MLTDPAGARPDAERYAFALEASGMGTWHWDRRTGRVDWDDALARVHGIGDGSFGGTLDDWVARIHPDDQEEVLGALDATVMRGVDHDLRYRTVRPDGTVGWVEGRGRAVRDGADEVVGMLGACSDVTARQEADGERARLLAAERRTRARWEFVAEASVLLARSLEIEAILQRLAWLVVPRLGDLCAIELLERGQWRSVALAHTDPRRVESLRRLRERFGSPMDRATGKSGPSVELIPEITDEMLRSVARDEPHFEALRGLGLASAVVVWLWARGQRIGALTLAHAGTGRCHSEEDAELALDIGRRAATAIDNAKLFRERSRVAAMLQRALLPPDLPQIDGVELASHYDTAEAIDIGGDFYDVLGVGEGWTLVIGDVRGKGVEAASQTALARHTVRAAAMHDPDPAHVLAVLNDAMLGFDPSESFCTAVCASLTVSGGQATLSVAAGGHPPPMVRRTDGSVEEIECSGTLLGQFPEIGFEAATVALDPGDLVCCYTDGLVEARRDDELFGAERVRSVLAACAGRSAAATVARLHAAAEAFQSEQRDDMALLAFRLLP